MNEGYQGWKNYQTWNVSLWINNDEGLYHMANSCRRARYPYKTFVSDLKEMAYESASDSIYYQTPDGVLWNDPTLDIDALDELIKDLNGDNAGIVPSL